MSHSDSKEKHGRAAKNQFNKTVHMLELVNYKSNEEVKERFYRPAYGKIGERGECYGER